MRKTLLVQLLLLIVLISVGGVVQGQTGVPLVAFIDENSLRMASITDPGPDGLTRLADLFREQGASTQFLRLDDPIPDDVTVVVLDRPLRALSPFYLGRLWVFLARGGNLLLALDPVGQFGVPDARGGGLDNILASEYGIHLFNGLIVGDGANNETVHDLLRTNFLANAADVDQPVIAPLRDYDVPVMLWGARNLQAELLTVSGSAVGLLYSDDRFAETNTRVFRTSDPDPVGVNIGQDDQGRLLVAALGQSDYTDSRVAVIGDGESLQNDYGLAPDPVTGRPLHIGNVVLAQRMISWLLHRPEDQWLDLPDGFTWVRIDGDGIDWGTRGTVTTDEHDQSVLSGDITLIRGFRNGDYAYLQVETASPPDSMARLIIDADLDVDGAVDQTLQVDGSANVIVSGDPAAAAEAIPDAAFAVNSVIEARIPTRVIGNGGSVARVCLTTTRELAFAQEPDCVENVIVTLVNESDPTGLNLPGLPLATIRTTGTVNLRTAPNTNASVVTRFSNGEIAVAAGRSDSGDWVFVQTAGNQGWITASLVMVNTALDTLPVLP